MSISIQQFLLSEGSKNSRLLKKSILLSRRSDEREKVINEKLNKINAQNVVPQKDPQTDVFAYFSVGYLQGFKQGFKEGAAFTVSNMPDDNENNFLSSFLNNKNMKGFSEGGRPPVGKPSIVGEKGAEIFVPDVSGTVISNKNINLSLPSMSKMRTVVQPIIQKDTQVVTKTIVKKQMQPVPIFISSNRKISKLASMIS
jgi:hypothetical protein|tara:strand:+ start:535 stop:1131 length:597 start_codon:yes stop_codon:yes gene_type:complete